MLFLVTLLNCILICSTSGKFSCAYTLLEHSSCSVLICTHIVLFLKNDSGSGSSSLEIAAGEFVEVEVWTRSVLGAAFTIVDHNDKKKTIAPKVEVKHTGGEDEASHPTCTKITTERLAGPLHIKLKADSHAGRFSCHNYLAVYKFFVKP